MSLYFVCIKQTNINNLFHFLKSKRDEICNEKWSCATLSIYEKFFIRRKLTLTFYSCYFLTADSDSLRASVHAGKRETYWPVEEVLIAAPRYFASHYHSTPSQDTNTYVCIEQVSIKTTSKFYYRQIYERTNGNKKKCSWGAKRKS